MQLHFFPLWELCAIHIMNPVFTVSVQCPGNSMLNISTQNWSVSYPKILGHHFAQHNNSLKRICLECQVKLWEQDSKRHNIKKDILNFLLNVLLVPFKRYYFFKPTLLLSTLLKSLVPKMSAEETLWVKVPKVHSTALRGCWEDLGEVARNIRIKWKIFKGALEMWTETWKGSKPEKKFRNHCVWEMLWFSNATTWKLVKVLSYLPMMTPETGY